MATVTPSLDHFTGRTLTEVLPGTDDEPWNWAVQLEGNVIIRNHDKRRKVPPLEGLEGLVFLMVTLSDQATEMKLGTSGGTGQASLKFTPLHYSIATPDTEEEVFPQRAPELEALLPEVYEQDYLDERVQEGSERDVSRSDAEPESESS
jgi:hypothetical protein